MYYKIYFIMYVFTSYMYIIVKTDNIIFFYYISSSSSTTSKMYIFLS